MSLKSIVNWTGLPLHQLWENHVVLSSQVILTRPSEGNTMITLTETNCKTVFFSHIQSSISGIRVDNQHLYLQFKILDIHYSLIFFLNGLAL